MSTVDAALEPRVDVRSSRALTVYAGVVVGFMVLVILEGAVVRATGSGAGCGNHWPLCNGDFFPHHPQLATVIEYLHRSMTGVCTGLVAGLIAWTFMARQRGDRARRAVVWSGVLLLTEAFLGAVLVKGGYVESNASNMRVLMQSIHFTNTMLLLAAIALTWWWLGERREIAVERRVRPVAWMALAATVVVGATGSVAALADTLFPSVSLRSALMSDFASGSPLLVRMRWIHPAAAVVALGCAMWLAVELRGSFARWIVGLAVVQVLLGVADVLLLAPTWMQVLHLLGADVYWIALVVAGASVLAVPVQAARRAVPAPVLGSKMGSTEVG
jgi:cytochrome c oxidase assembly protein subunit 15